MKILALDTATENCSVALLVGDRLVTREAEMQRGHAERILPMVQEVLAEAGLALEQLDAIAFGRGPGGFTGVRLCASVTQGLAFGAGVPVVPVSDLAAVAQRVFEARSPSSHELAPAGTPQRVLVCNDARMREVYWACFERGPDGLAVAVGEEHVGPSDSVALPASWVMPASASAVGPTPGQVASAPSGAGRGFAAYPELNDRLKAALGTIDSTPLPRATEILRLAIPLFQSGYTLAPELAIPTYLRNDVAKPKSPG